MTTLTQALGRYRPTPASVTTSSSGVTTVTELPMPVNLDLYAGDDFSRQLTLTDPDGSATDLSQASAQSQIRLKQTSTDVVLSFICAIADNIITLTLLGADTQNLKGKYVWDCQVVSPGNAVLTLTAGTVIFTQDVTRTLGT